MFKECLIEVLSANIFFSDVRSAEIFERCDNKSVIGLSSVITVLLVAGARPYSLN